MGGKRHPSRCYNIVTICPAPPGSRAAYADPTAENGVRYDPIYVLALCDEQLMESIDGAPPKPVGGPLRSILGVNWGHDGILTIAEQHDDCLGCYPPGVDVDEDDARVMAARAAVR